MRAGDVHDDREIGTRRIQRGFANGSGDRHAGSPAVDDKLETLARRTEQPLTRMELLDHVWGADYEGDSNVVDVYVGYVRRKLQPHGDPAMIETVRGVGYRFSD